MTVSEMKKRLADMPDDAVLVLDGPDHSYLKVRGVAQRKAEKHDQHTYIEYWRDETKVSPDNPVVDVVLVS